MKRRILFVAPSLTLPSDATQLKLLATGLASRDADIHVASIADQVGANFGLPNVTVHPLGIRHHIDCQRPPHDSIALAGSLSQLVATLRPDVVHLWDVDAAVETHFALRQFRSIKLYQTFLSTKIPRSYVRRAIQRRFVSLPSKIAVPHAAVAQDLIEAEYPESSISIIPNAVRGDAIDRGSAKQQLTSALNLPSSIYLASSIAPLEPRFRLKDLVWATDLLNCVRDDFHFVIVGSGRQRARLEKFISQTEATGHIHFIDCRPGDLSLHTIVAGSDVYWNSHLNWPLPSPMMQAMSVGTPVVSVLGEATKALVRHQETGFAVNFGARDEFARWTKYLIERSESAQQLRLQGQRFVGEHFDVANMIDDYECWYDAG